MSERRFYVCDRCGERIDGKTDLNDTYFFIHKITKYSIRFLSEFNTGFGRDEVSLDLCPDCTKQLDDFIFGYGKSDKENK